MSAKCRHMQLMMTLVLKLHHLQALQLAISDQLYLLHWFKYKSLNKGERYEWRPKIICSSDILFTYMQGSSKYVSVIKGRRYGNSKACIACIWQVNVG